MEVKVVSFDAIAVLGVFGAGVAAGVAGERIRVSRPNCQNCSSHGELASPAADEADVEWRMTPAAELIIILTTDTQGELWH